MGQHRKPGGCLITMVGLIVGILALLLLGGCSENSPSQSNSDPFCTDAPKNCISGTNVKILTNSDSFEYVLIECVGTTGIYIPAQSDMQLYPNDPRCLNQTEPFSNPSSVG